MNDIQNNDQSSNSNNKFPSYLKFKRLTFYDVIYEVIKPTVLFTNEEKIHFVLSNENISQITANRHIPGDENRNNYQLQIRIGQLESKVTSLNEVTDYFPQGLNIHVNTIPCTLPSVRPKPGIAPGRLLVAPIDCTKLVKLTPNTENTISIKWTPDTKTYAVVMCIVNKLTARTLFENLLNKERINMEKTRDEIFKLLKNDNDPDLAITSITLSLICPLTKIKMFAPTKSSRCDHFECFDGYTFIKMNEIKEKWRCPICNLDCFYEDLKIDNYILSILNNPTIKTDPIGKKITSVQISPNNGCEISVNHDEIITLDDD
ncbi:E3 SUMO-protein ligase PIAS1-like [Rhopalosiphum maidis]|uniref:E3 SUMO-protein ligase PIAS1-like n=1 Tax=Rhopalosiphum maidis TaxID=43146 RepID=UPI000EFDFB4B|nr:E3 SUMO-protein ligase PIAS1-like [Rhopalosiphum maidis]XP_026816875.1 E3 SUMO-protein ligase PIAS1-like [Rhopalosiphum maidis]XP_026816883.1 E3 SUMO-protein ligase PIAS1-like [Rhopalosiphum maidis]